MQSVSEISAFLSKKSIIVVSVLAKSDLFGSLNADLLLLEAVLHLLQNCGSNGHNVYSIVKAFAGTFVVCITMR